MWPIVVSVLVAGGAVLWLGLPALLPIALIWPALRLLRARQVWLLAAVLAYVPFSFFLEEFALGEQVGAFNTVGMLKDIMHILVFGLIVGRAALRREALAQNDTANRLFFAYFGWVLIHIVNPTALMPGFWAWRIYVEFAVFYLLVRMVVENEIDVRRLMVVWALLAIPVMGFAVAKIATGGLLAFYGQADTWEGARLSFGGETNANHLALFLVPVVIGAVGLAWSSASRKARLLWLALAALAFLQTGMTLSRRSYLALALGFAVLAWFDKRRKWWFGLGLLGAVAAVPFLPAGIFDRIVSMVDFTDYRNVGRFEEWWEILAAVFAGPVQALWGIGPGRVGQVALDFKAAGAISSHNSYLLQLADLGLVGLAFLVGLIGYHIALAARIARRHRGTTLGKLAATLLAIQLAYALTAVFGITYHNYPTNLLAWLSMGLVQVLARQARQATDTPPLKLAPVVARVLPHWKKLLALGFAVAVAAYGVALLLPQQWRASTSAMIYTDPPPEIDLFGANDPLAAAFADQPGPPGGKEALRVLFALQSKQALHDACAELGLLPALFPERWDAEQNRWRKTPPTPTQVHEKVWKQNVFVDYFRLTGRLRVTAQWSDPQTAAALAAAVLRHGDRLAAKGLREHADAKRAALDEDLGDVAARLKTAETELAVFRAENELVQPAYQGAVAVKLRGDLAGLRVTKDTQRSLLLSITAPGHPKVRLYDAKIASLDEAAARLHTGAYPYLPALNEWPQLQMTDRRLARDRDLLTVELTHVAPLVAKWRVRSEMAQPMLIAYEPPVVPERRHTPARTLIAFAAAAFAGYLALIFLLAKPGFLRHSA